MNLSELKHNTYLLMNIKYELKVKHICYNNSYWEFLEITGNVIILKLVFCRSHSHCLIIIIYFWNLIIISIQMQLIRFTII